MNEHHGLRGVRGFTLIELMIVCAIIALLATLAYPSYAEHVRKGRRADAQRALQEASQFLRRYYSSMDNYVGATLPMSRTPQEGPAAYTITLIEKGAPATAATALSAQTYTLRATRTGAMTGDRCGDLQLTHTGARTLVNAGTGATLADCFRGG